MLSLPPPYPAGGIQVGDVVTYQLPGRQIKDWPLRTSQFVEQVNDAGDVLTQKEGWRPAGSFQHHRPLRATEREPTTQDTYLMAAGHRWFILGKAMPKEPTRLTERQQRNGTYRAKLEVERAAVVHARAVATTPPLFYEQPTAPQPRYSTAEGANRHLLLIRDDFTAARREVRARNIREIRARLQRLPAAEVQLLHRAWQAQLRSCGLEYLLCFLYSYTRSAKPTPYGTT